MTTLILLSILCTGGCGGTSIVTTRVVSPFVAGHGFNHAKVVNFGHFGHSAHLVTPIPIATYAVRDYNAQAELQELTQKQENLIEQQSRLLQSYSQQVQQLQLVQQQQAQQFQLLQQQSLNQPACINGNCQIQNQQQGFGYTQTQQNFSQPQPPITQQDAPIQQQSGNGLSGDGYSLFQERCVKCHRPGGSYGSYDLSGSLSVVRRLKALDYALSGDMPPSGKLPDEELVKIQSFLAPTRAELEQGDR